MDPFFYFVSIQASKNKVQVWRWDAGIISVMSWDEFLRFAPLAVEVIKGDELDAELLLRLQPISLRLETPPSDMGFVKQLTRLERLSLITEHTGRGYVLDPTFKLLISPL
jgi:hypothetical protein